MIYWIIWAVVGLLFFSLYAVKILPGLFRIAVGFADKTRDRGLATLNLSEGISVLYEPDASSAPYIRRYQIYRIKSSGYTPVFLGEWGRRPKSIEYEVSAYDRHQFLLARKRVCKNPAQTRYTEALTLPSETAYVSLCVRRADGEAIHRPKTKDRRFWRFLALFAAAAAFALAGFIFVILSFLLRALSYFGDGPLLPAPALWLVFLLLPALILFGVILLMGYLLGYRKQTVPKSAPSARRQSLASRHLSPLRILFIKIRCVFCNFGAALRQSRFVTVCHRAVAALTRPLRTRRGRRKNRD